MMGWECRRHLRFSWVQGPVQSPQWAAVAISNCECGQLPVGDTSVNRESLMGLSLPAQKQRDGLGGPRRSLPGLTSEDLLTWYKECLEAGGETLGGSLLRPL